METLKQVALILMKLLFAFILAVVLIFSVFFGYLIWKSRSTEIEYKEHTSLMSNDSSYNLMIEVGNPVLPYGPHSVMITVLNTSTSKVLITKKTNLSNDGARIESENIDVQWTDKNTAKICIRGDEQKDTLISIDVASQLITETEIQC